MNTSDFLIAAAIAGAFVLVAVLVSLSPKTKTTVPTKKLIRKTN